MEGEGKKEKKKNRSKGPKPIPSLVQESSGTIDLPLPARTEMKSNSNPKRKGEKKREEKAEERQIDSMKEMEKDAEYRRLNAKIKEQEYRMRQIEMNAKASRDLSGQIAKKVEEEVRQKLSQAAILTAMYKSDETSSPDGPRSDTRGGSKSQKKRNDRRNTERPEKEQNHQGSRNTSPPSTSSALPLKPSARSQIRLPKDAAPFKHQHQDHHSDLIENELPREPKVTEKEKLFLQLEADIKRAIDEIRRDKAALQDFCLLGPSNGAPDYALKCTEFENLILEKLTSGETHQACRNKDLQKLTEMKLKQLGLFHAVLSSAMNSEARVTKESLISQVLLLFLFLPPSLPSSHSCWLIDRHCLSF
jgi:hypothetical protein